MGRFHIAAQRFPLLPPVLHLPVLGEWTVYQGENGPWTHQHAWAHAVDLVLTGPDGETHSGKGTHLPDYHAWDKTVVSPIQGVVETVVSDRPDLPLGSVDTEANWGNHVIIRSPEGWRVLMAHLRQSSLQVVPGQSVAVGQWIGRCGNSGYSPEPHLHLHVQQEAHAGAATIPFTFHHLAVDGHLDLPVVPETGQRVEARELQPDLIAATSYLLDQKLHFRDQRGRERRYHMELAPNGVFRLQGEQGF